jgi:hypothetical protein
MPEWSDTEVAVVLSEPSTTPPGVKKHAAIIIRPAGR